MQRKTFEHPLLLVKFFLLFYGGIYALAPFFMLRAGFHDALLPIEAVLSVPISMALIGWSVWSIRGLLRGLLKFEGKN